MRHTASARPYILREALSCGEEETTSGLLIVGTSYSDQICQGTLRICQREAFVAIASADLHMSLHLIFTVMATSSCVSLSGLEAPWGGSRLAKISLRGSFIARAVKVVEKI